MGSHEILAFLGHSGITPTSDIKEIWAEVRRWGPAGVDQLTMATSTSAERTETIRLMGEYVIPNLDTESAVSTSRYRGAAR